MDKQPSGQERFVAGLIERPANPPPLAFMFTATPDLYRLRDGVSKADVFDQLHARSGQLVAMLHSIGGEGGFENFSGMNERLQQDFLWACTSAAQELDDLLHAHSDAA